jgi:hypothetical protein
MSDLPNICPATEGNIIMGTTASSERGDIGISEAESDALVCAASAGNLKSVEKAFTEHDQISSEFTNKDKALLAATKSGHLPVVKFLIQNGVSARRCTELPRRYSVGPDSRKSAIFLAVMGGHHSVANALLCGGADVGEVEPLAGSTLLIQGDL